MVADPRTRGRIPLGYAAPLLLMGLPVAVAPLLGLQHAASTNVFYLCCVLHVVGADWLLIAGFRPRIRGRGLTLLKLAIGAPSGLWALGGIALIAHEGDIAWEGLPLVLFPAAFVWPVMLLSLLWGPPDGEGA